MTSSSLAMVAHASRSLVMICSPVCTRRVMLAPLSAPPADVYVERHVQMARGVRASPKIPETVSNVAPRS